MIPQAVGYGGFNSYGLINLEKNLILHWKQVDPSLLEHFMD